MGEPVPETTDAALDAAVAAAVAAFPAWSGSVGGRRHLRPWPMRSTPARARLAAIAVPETALGGEPLIGEVARTTGQLRLFAGVLRDSEGAGGVVPPGQHPVTWTRW